MYSLEHFDVIAGTMGSVGENYKCPLCGRVGNGGYSMDGIGFPICTEGDYSCLWYQVIEKGLWPGNIVAKALQKIFVKSKWCDLGDEV